MAESFCRSCDLLVIENAQLREAAERCVRKCDEIAAQELAVRVDQAVAAERERCREKLGAERDRWARRLLAERAAERERCAQLEWALDKIARHPHATGEIRRHAGEALGREYNADGAAIRKGELMSSPPNAPAEFTKAERDKYYKLLKAFLGDE